MSERPFCVTPPEVLLEASGGQLPDYMTPDTLDIKPAIAALRSEAGSQDCPARASKWQCIVSKKGGTSITSDQVSGAGSQAFAVGIDASRKQENNRVQPKQPYKDTCPKVSLQKGL